MNQVIYTLLLIALTLCGRKFYNYLFAILIGVLGNLEIINTLSLTQWIESLCGNASLFLGFICLISILRPILPEYFILSYQSKIFIFILGFFLFIGNLNFLWGWDVYYFDFQSQMLIAIIISIAGFLIQPILGFLYLGCLLISQGENLFAEMIDVLVWLYALLSLLKILGKKYAHSIHS